MNIKTKISKYRHIFKTITWRIVGTLDTLLISWILTGDIFIGLSISGVEVITKMVLYYLHERAWYKIDFGIEKETLYENLKPMFDVKDMIIGDQNTNTEECKCDKSPGVNNTTNRCIACNNLIPNF